MRASRQGKWTKRACTLAPRGLDRCRLPQSHDEPLHLWRQLIGATKESIRLRSREKSHREAKRNCSFLLRETQPQSPATNGPTSWMELNPRDTPMPSTKSPRFLLNLRPLASSSVSARLAVNAISSSICPFDASNAYNHSLLLTPFHSA